MDTVEAFRNVLTHLGLDLEEVDITTDYEDAKRLFKELNTIYGQFGDYFLELRGERSFEEVFIKPGGRAAVYLNPRANREWLYHAAGHVYVLKKLRLNVMVGIPIIKQKEIDESLLRSFLFPVFMYIKNLQNLLGDVLADYAVKNVAGEDYWNYMVSVASKFEEDMLRFFTVQASEWDVVIGNKYIEYLDYIVRVSYLGAESAAIEDALEAYAKTPSFEGALRVVELFVRASKHFNVSLGAELKKDEKFLVNVYLITLPELYVIQV